MHINVQRIRSGYFQEVSFHTRHHSAADIRQTIHTYWRCEGQILIRQEADCDWDQLFLSFFTKNNFIFHFAFIYKKIQEALSSTAVLFTTTLDPALFSLWLFKCPLALPLITIRLGVNFLMLNEFTSLILWNGEKLIKLGLDDIEKKHINKFR